MRLKTFFTLICFVLGYFLLVSTQVLACCEGMCNTHDTCSFTNTSTCATAFVPCEPDYQIVVTCSSGTAGSYDPENPYAEYSPIGYSTTVCSNICSKDPGNSGCGATITETKSIWCGDCAPPISGGGGDDGGGEGGGSPAAPTPADPTPTPAGPTPTGTRTPTPTPTPGIVLISGSINEDVAAGLSGSFCRQETSAPLSVTGSNLFASNIADNYAASFNNNNFSINTVYAGTYSVILDLSNQTGGYDYVCSCPAAIDPNNPYLCRYSGVTSPTSNVNFYLKSRNLSNESWFQVFGGNFFAKNLISSPIPFSFCDGDSSCQAALSVPLANSSNQLSSGFPIITSSNPNNVRSSRSSSAYHDYLHLDNRTSNFNSYVTSSPVTLPSYDYLRSLAAGSIHELAEPNLKPSFASLVASPLWSNEEVNYLQLNGNISIDETQGFNLTSSQALVIFVNGNLTFDDSNVSDSNRKITSVAPGGFLAFIVNGDITISANIGYELNPNSPSIPAVSIANSNLSGVFMAENILTVQSKTAIGGTLPDKKFIGSGTFVGKTAVNLNRTFADDNLGARLNNNQAIENFIYRADFLANWPTKLKTPITNWHEMAPQLVTQE